MELNPNPNADSNTNTKVVPIDRDLADRMTEIIQIIDGLTEDDYVNLNKPSHYYQTDNMSNNNNNNNSNNNNKDYGIANGIRIIDMGNPFLNSYGYPSNNVNINNDNRTIINNYVVNEGKTDNNADPNKKEENEKEKELEQIRKRNQILGAILLSAFGIISTWVLAKDGYIRLYMSNLSKKISECEMANLRRGMIKNSKQKPNNFMRDNLNNNVDNNVDRSVDEAIEKCKKWLEIYRIRKQNRFIIKAGVLGGLVGAASSVFFGSHNTLLASIFFTGLTTSFGIWRSSSQNHSLEFSRYNEMKVTLQNIINRCNVLASAPTTDDNDNNNNNGEYDEFSKYQMRNFDGKNNNYFYEEKK